MAYEYRSANEQAMAFVKELSQNLKPEDAVLIDALKESPQHATGKHYTFSAMVSDELRDSLRPITEALSKLDPTLVVNPPELYHITLFWCQIDKNAEGLAEIIENKLRQEQLSFRLHGLISAPFGISLKAYPTSTTFVEVREELHAAVGQQPLTNADGTYHERFVSTWINLARYATPPSSDVLAYVRERIDEDFGTFTPDGIGLYITDNKYLRDAELVRMIPNGPTE